MDGEFIIIDTDNAGPAKPFDLNPKRSIAKTVLSGICYVLNKSYCDKQKKLKTALNKIIENTCDIYSLYYDKTIALNINVDDCDSDNELMEQILTSFMTHYGHKLINYRQRPQFCLNNDTLYYTLTTIYKDCKFTNTFTITQNKYIHYSRKLDMIYITSDLPSSPPPAYDHQL